MLVTTSSLFNGLCLILQAFDYLTSPQDGESYKTKIFWEDYTPIHAKRAEGVHHVTTKFNGKTVKVVCVAVGPCSPSPFLLGPCHKPSRTRDHKNKGIMEQSDGRASSPIWSWAQLSQPLVIHLWVVKKESFLTSFSHCKSGTCYVQLVQLTINLINDSILTFIIHNL